MKTFRRGQATVELALGSLVLISLILFGIYFGEVTFGALKVQEAANSALFDLTYYKHHSMVGTYSSAAISDAVTKARIKTSFDYQDFDGRTGAWAIRSPNITHVLTATNGMSVTCERGGGPNFSPNRVLDGFGPLATYRGNTGAHCQTSADFLTTPMMPRKVAEESSTGFFAAAHWTRASLRICGAGKARSGNCTGNYNIMLDDWGLTGPQGGEWMPAPGFEFGLTLNEAYWSTALRGYTTSYAINAALPGNEGMSGLPATQLAMLETGINPMGGSTSWFPPVTGNEAKFYMTFDSSFIGFEHLLLPFMGGLPERSGLNWETTPFAVSLMPYSTAFIARKRNGGCYLGLPC